LRQEQQVALRHEGDATDLVDGRGSWCLRTQDTARVRLVQTATMVKSVLLPQPLGATTVTNSPAQRRSKSANDLIGPNVLVTARSSEWHGLAAASGDRRRWA